MPAAGLEKLSPADWEGLVDMALRFKVGGMFYREIRSPDFPAELIPAGGRKRLREAYRSLATMNTSLFLDVLRVLKSLGAARMPVIALKGLSLARNVYGDIALRPMSDVDLLVKEDDLVMAGRILLTLGYKQRFPAWESMARAFHHLPPFKNDRGAMIELHRNIVSPESPIKVDLDGLWERARPIKIDQVEVLALSPEDLLIHLCIHACYHLQTGMDLIPFCDIAGLIRRSADKIDWRTVVERAARWGGQKCVYLMLLLVRELMGTAPPDSVMSEMKPADYRSVYLEEALEQLWDVGPSGHLIIKGIGLLSRIRKAKGMKRRSSTLFKAAFPSREQMARIYPVPLSGPKIYVCYLFRLGRRIASYALVVFRLIRRDRPVIAAIHQERRGSSVSDWMFS